jgi:hypothetical protein
MRPTFLLGRLPDLLLTAPSSLPSSLLLARRRLFFLRTFPLEFLRPGWPRWSSALLPCMVEVGSSSLHLLPISLLPYAIGLFLIYLFCFACSFWSCSSCSQRKDQERGQWTQSGWSPLFQCWFCPLRICCSMKCLSSNLMRFLCLFSLRLLSVRVCCFFSSLSKG